jgi:hypothetical protein
MKMILFAAIAFATISTNVFANNISNNKMMVSEMPAGEKIKVKLQNKGDDKIEIFYQETVGSKNLSSASINQGSTITIAVEVGCDVHYKVKGSKGPLLLNITDKMSGTTQIIKQ